MLYDDEDWATELRVNVAMLQVKSCYAAVRTALG